MGAPIWPAPTNATRMAALLGWGHADGVGLDLGVLLEAFDAVLASDPAGLVATERRVGSVGGAAVDAHQTGPQLLAHRLGALDGTRRDIRAEPVLVVVGKPDCLLVTVERDDDEHGAEDLLARDGHVVGDVREER